MPTRWQPCGTPLAIDSGRDAPPGPETPALLSTPAFCPCILWTLARNPQPGPSLGVSPSCGVRSVPWGWASSPAPVLPPPLPGGDARAPGLWGALGPWSATPTVRLRRRSPGGSFPTLWTLQCCGRPTQALSTAAQCQAWEQPQQGTPGPRPSSVPGVMAPYKRLHPPGRGMSFVLLTVTWRLWVTLEAFPRELAPWVPRWALS